MLESSELVTYICENFIKGGAVQRGSNPGFSHAIKLSYNTIDKQRLSMGPKSLSYRYTLSQDVPKFTIGLLTALMDELSTDACFRVGLPCTPGVSLQMQTELDDHMDLSSFTEINVVNIVTKLGKTVSHTRTEFRCVDSNQIIACSSHIKYMPTGNRLIDILMKNRFLYDLYQRFYLRTTQPPFYDEKPLYKDVIQSHLVFHGLGRATFHVTREHTNPFGSLHGGCHAMIMEAVAEPYARSLLKSDAVVLQAMHMEFLAAAKGSIDVMCEIISCGSTIQIRVLLVGNERTTSEGKLRFSASIQSRL